MTIIAHLKNSGQGLAINIYSRIKVKDQGQGLAINIPAGDAKLVSTDGFWPMFVQCKPWQRIRDNQSIERGRNTILKGYYNSV